jgi:hypothetical protein
LLELVRFIHPNPLQAKLVKDLSDLDEYPYAGNRVLMGKGNHPWQDTAHVLSRFGRTAKEGIPMGKRSDLVGGGLVRSMGRWAAVKALRKAKVYMKGDERILGDSDFAE